MNNKYVITFQHPLLRPGITIKTEASEKYVPAVVKKCMELIREINAEDLTAPLADKKVD